MFTRGKSSRVRREERSLEFFNSIYQGWGTSIVSIERVFGPLKSTGPKRKLKPQPNYMTYIQTLDVTK